MAQDRIPSRARCYASTRIHEDEPMEDLERISHFLLLEYLKALFYACVRGTSSLRINFISNPSTGADIKMGIRFINFLHISVIDVFTE